jgi:hypothetical protein
VSAVVMLSGGAGSWAAGRRYIDTHGLDGVTLLFTDVGDGSSEHLGEDPDTYRFLDDAAANLGVPLVRLGGDRNIYDVFHEKRWLGNARVAHCSWELKTKPAREWVDANCPPDTEIVVGIDWTETHRIPKIAEAWLPYRAVAPLAERPYLAKPQVLGWLRKSGLVPPRMYALGFAHANCRGCVKAGQAHWARLLEVFPATYAYHEAREQEMRDELGDVAILRDRTDGDTRALTLRELRETRQDRQIDLFDEGGCGCFTLDEGVPA